MIQQVKQVFADGFVFGQKIHHFCVCSFIFGWAPHRNDLEFVRPNVSTIRKADRHTIRLYPRKFVHPVLEIP
jgi:hypothetical protein